ncbi:very short patch repair endonuclease [Alistipes indistinctus]|uniref:very short patch repair endonuclease n=1 Tax=Alistipes indistinctus TaxID=626932 RepID=UPI0005905E46|nr:DNA mismatch endonuclease Vsr [Alistipes indistinctus]UWN60164.1 DNA mismatch endonuclease Vsr [Alistipes indistinctus YIT 12060]
MDIWNKSSRSKIMSLVNQKDTKPELVVRKYLFAAGFRYRKNDRRLPGSPDIVLPKYKTVVFVNGCFWHGHDCRAGRRPQSNEAYWNEKLEGNIIRDRKKIEQIEALEWKVLIVWQCEIKNIESRKQRLERLVEEIKQ